MTTIGGIAVEANKYAAFTGSLTQNLNANNFNISGVKTLSATNVSGLLTTGVQSNITGLGVQTQNLDMGGRSIIGAGTISTGISPLSTDLDCNNKALTNASSISATSLFGTVQTGSQPGITSLGPQSQSLDMNTKSIIKIGNLTISNPNVDEIGTSLVNGSINLRPNGTGHVNLFKNLDMQSHRVINLPAPTADNDAARKSYVDGVLANSKEAGTLTGFTLAPLVVNSSLQNLGPQDEALDMNFANKIINLATPTLNTDAATKAYVDTAANNARDANNLTGTVLKNTVVTSSLQSLGLQSTTLNMNSNKITNLASPTADVDAATKAYADSAKAAIGLTGDTLAGGVTKSSIGRLGQQTQNLDMGTNRVTNMAAPTQGFDAVTLTYFNAGIAAAKEASFLTGTVLAGNIVESSLQKLGDQAENLNMGAFRITNMGTPQFDDNAATKAYVDTAASNAKNANTLTGTTLAPTVVTSSLTRLGTMAQNLNMGSSAIVGADNTNINISPNGLGLVSINGSLRVGNVTSLIDTDIVINPSGIGKVILRKELNMDSQNINNVFSLTANTITTVTNANLTISPAGTGIVGITKKLDMNFNNIDNVGTISNASSNLVGISSNLSMNSRSISQVNTISGISSPATNLNIQTSGTSQIVMNNELNMSNKNISGVDTISVSTLFGRVAAGGLGLNGRDGGIGFYSNYGNNYFKTNLPYANSIIIDGDAGYQKSIHFQNGNSTKWQMGMNSIDNTSGNWFLYDSTLGVNLFEFAQAGAPTTNYRLPRLGTLDGTVQAYSISGAAGYLRVASSDRRIKQNEALLDSSKSLEKIINLKPKSFDYAAHYPGKPDVGFIAQELEQYIPEAVDGKKFEYEFQRERGEPGKDGALIKDADGNPLLDYSQPRYRTVREMPILSTLVSAVQELEKRNRMLEERVAELHEIVAEFVSEFVPNKRQRV